MLIDYNSLILDLYQIYQTLFWYISNFNFKFDFLIQITENKDKAMFTVPVVDLDILSQYDDAKLKPWFDWMSNIVIGSDAAKASFLWKAAAIAGVLAISTAITLIGVPCVSPEGLIFVYLLLALSISPNASIGEALVMPIATGVLASTNVIGCKIAVIMGAAEFLESIISPVTDTHIAVFGSLFSVGGIDCGHLLEYIYKFLGISLPISNEGILVVHDTINDLRPKGVTYSKCDLNLGIQSLKKAVMLMDNGVVSFIDEFCRGKAALLGKVFIIKDEFIIIKEVMLLDIKFNEAIKDFLTQNLVFQDAVTILKEASMVNDNVSLKNICIGDVVIKDGDLSLKDFVLNDSILKNKIDTATIVGGNIFVKDDLFILKRVLLENVILKNDAIVIKDGNLLFMDEIFKNVAFEGKNLVIKEGNFDASKLTFERYIFF